MSLIPELPSDVWTLIAAHGGFRLRCIVGVAKLDFRVAAAHRLQAAARRMMMLSTGPFRNGELVRVYYRPGLSRMRNGRILTWDPLVLYSRYGEGRQTLLFLHRKQFRMRRLHHRPRVERMSGLNFRHQIQNFSK